MKKILGICGDSFMSADASDDPLDNPNGRTAYGKHFSEILGKMLDCDVISYARGGVSNHCIRLQIDEIIKHNPDHIIIGTTSPDRIEIPLEDLSVKSEIEKWGQFNFNPDNGIYNIFYSDYNNVSKLHEGFKNIKPTMYSQTISTILTQDNFLVSVKSKLSKDTTNAVKMYFQYLYDMQWKKMQDTWIISDGLHKLIDLGYDFSVIPEHLYVDKISYCGDKLILDKKLSPWTYYNHDKICHNNFHISDEDSSILAKLWYNKLKYKFIDFSLRKII